MYILVCVYVERVCIPLKLMKDQSSTNSVYVLIHVKTIFLVLNWLSDLSVQGLNAECVSFVLFHAVKGRLVEIIIVVV